VSQAIAETQRTAASRTGANARRIELVRELFRRRLLTGGARRAEAGPATPPRDAGGRSASLR